MRCPNCQNEVPDGHFYCPGCQALVYSYVPVDQPKRGRLERAGKRLFDLVLILVLIGAGVLLVRVIKWREVANGFKPVTGSSPSVKTDRVPSSKSSVKRRTSNSSGSSAQGTKGNSSKPASAESVRDLKQKIEELPSSPETGQSTKPAAKASPTPSKNEPH